LPVFAQPIGGTVATMRNSCTSLSTSMRRGSASPLLPYPFRRSGRSCGYRERRACVMAAASGYLFAGLKRVFGGNPKRSLLKAFAVAVSYVAVLITATVV